MKPCAMDMTSTGLHISTAHCCSVPEHAAAAPLAPLQGHCPRVSSLGWLFSWEPAVFLSYTLFTYWSPCLLLLANSLPLARVQDHVAAASISSYPYFHIPHRKGKLLFSFTFVSHSIEWRATNKQYRMQMHHLTIRRKKPSLKFRSSVFYFCFHEWKNIYACTHRIFRMKLSVAKAWLKSLCPWLVSVLPVYPYPVFLNLLFYLPAARVGGAVVRSVIKTNRTIW